MQTSLAFQPTAELKRCPRCELWLPLSAFGICNARPDKLNLYDRKCVREKIAIGRAALREYNAVRQANKLTPRYVQSPQAMNPRRLARMLRKLQPADRVFEAIKCGAQEQSDIARATKLTKDEVTDAIAQLLLWSYKIRTQVIKGKRMYFVNESGESQTRQQPIRPPREPRSYGVSDIYFALSPAA